MAVTWVNQSPGIPVASNFNTTQGQGPPLVVNTAASTLYYLAAGDIPKIIFGPDNASVTVEQFGATGTPGVNDQPAIQAAVTYANANGIPLVRFTKAAYELWCPIRTTQTGPGAATDTDGYPIRITKAVALVGVAGKSTLTFKNSSGGNKTTITQTTAWGQWQGGGIFINANPSGAVANIPFIHFENLVLASTTADWVSGNGGSNVSDKGFGFYSNGTYGVDRLTMRNVIAHHFSGEIFYGGCFDPNSTIIVEDVELYHSQQSAWNATGTGKVHAVNLYAHDSYQVSEAILGQGHTYVGCRFTNGSVAIFIGTQYYVGGYYYAYPNRDLTKVPTWYTFIGTTFEKIPNTTLASWARGSITLIDSSLSIGSFSDRDIYLDIETWFDQQATAILIAGPQNLTTQFINSPAGIYYEPPKNIRLNIKAKRTARAVANNITGDAVSYSGLIDKATVRVDISGEARNAISPTVGTRPAGYAQPLTVVAPDITLMLGGQPFGGIDTYPAANVTHQVNWSAATFNPSGTGPYTVTLGTTYTYANGQLVTFYYGTNTTQEMTFAASGAGMSLNQPRKLAGKGDTLVLRWDDRYSTWVEVSYISLRIEVFLGSATYDAPNILAAGTTTTTVTATGAALGDFVDRISLGVSAVGLVITGYVSAVNTVTVVLYNPTAGAIDLASTTLSVEVRKKF